MTILHIITRLILGGAQQNTILSCSAQIRASHRVTLAYGPIYGPEGSMLDEARASGADLTEIPSMRRAVRPIRDVLCYRALRQLIQQLKPDVVHTHSSKAGVLGRAAAWAQQVPAVIHTIHGLPFHDGQNRFVHDAFVAAERWAARRCHHLIAVAPEMVEAFSSKRIANPARFTVIASGLDLVRFNPGSVDREAVRQELGIPQEAPVLGVVARLDHLKGHDDLLDIFPDLLPQFPSLRLLLIGDGHRRPHLERRVRDEGLTDRVLFTGLVPHEKVGRFLAAADVKALPSYQEGQPRTLAEALLCGCGVVAYDVGGIRSICIDGQTGRLVPVGQKQALKQAIAWMFEHPAERQALTERGRSHVRRVLDADLMVKMIEQVYEQVLHGQHPRGGTSS